MEGSLHTTSISIWIWWLLGGIIGCWDVTSSKGFDGG